MIAVQCIISDCIRSKRCISWGSMAAMCMNIIFHLLIKFQDGQAAISV